MHRWLWDTPCAIVFACVAEMPRLQAEERFTHVACVALGTGSLPKEVARDIRRDWARDARGGDGPPRRGQWPRGHVASKDELAAWEQELGAHGIGIRRVPKKQVN